MSRRIEHSARYSGAPAALHSAFTDPEYWRARVDAVGGPGASIEKFDAVDAGVQVELTQVIAEEHLPGIVKRVKSGDLAVQRTESWGPLQGDTAAGAFTATVSGTPIKMRGEHALDREGDSCTVHTSGQAHVAVPLIGGKIEQIIADNLSRLLDLEQQFTEQWLAEH